MADLNLSDKLKIEKFLGMNTGYVLDFSDRTFQEFISETVGLDIKDTKYQYLSNSKANRLRQFIKTESNYTIGKLLLAFCEYWLTKVHAGIIDPRSDEAVYKDCIEIGERLKQDKIIDHIDAIQPNVDDRDFNLLAKSIKESIEKNEPETALDRLHTFTFRYIRELCEKHGIAYEKTNSMNALLGKYIKFLLENEHIESTMSEKIMKYSINVIEAFNDIRNNKSFAHDNPILNYHESVLIFNNVSNTIKFIDFIEQSINKNAEKEQVNWTELPF